MKKFEFVDLNGKKRSLSPSFFASSPSILGISDKMSDVYYLELSAYAVKAHIYMTARHERRQARRQAYKALFDKISFLASCGFPGIPLCEVLDAFGKAYALQSVYRHHVAFCRGYVPINERDNPPIEFYFGTLGGGFAYYTEFSTRYRYRHLILLSSFWFTLGDVSLGYSDSKVNLFEKFCKHGELSIGS